MDAQPQQEMKETAKTSIRRIAGNVVSIMSSNVTIRATNFFMYILVGRILGAFQLGQLSLAMSLLYTIHLFSLVGLKTIVTREIARDRSLTGQYFINSSGIVAAASILFTLLMVPFVKILNYSPDTARVILLLFLGLAPFALTQICEGIFQAWEKMELIAYAQVPLNLIQFGVVAVLLARGYGVIPIVLTIVISYGIILLIEWWFLLRYITIPEAKFDFRLSQKLLRVSLPFLGIQGTNAIKSSASVVLLSILLGETEVGIFSAANQLLAPFGLIYDNVVNGVFPVMVRKFTTGIRNLQRITEILIEFLLSIALPVVVGLLITADTVLLALYDDPEFLGAAAVLRILVWLPLGEAMTKVLGQVLWASDHEKIALRIAIVNTLIKIIVGYLLIRQSGLLGAAVATALVLVVNLIQHYLPVSKLLSGMRLGRLIWRPLIATAGMAVFVLASSTMNIVTRAISAVVLYSVLLALVFIWSSGGLGGFRDRYQYLWARGEQ